MLKGFFCSLDLIDDGVRSQFGQGIATSLEDKWKNRLPGRGQFTGSGGIESKDFLETFAGAQGLNLAQVDPCFVQVEQL